jgi:hypothetical protein
LQKPFFILLTLDFSLQLLLLLVTPLQFPINGVKILLLAVKEVSAAFDFVGQLSKLLLKLNFFIEAFVNLGNQPLLFSPQSRFNLLVVVHFKLQVFHFVLQHNVQIACLAFLVFF